MITRLPRLKRGGAPQPPERVEELSSPPEYCTFALFGITVRVPGRWLAYPQQNRDRLSWNSGFFKFEECPDPATACSLGIQWESKSTNSARFLEDYPRQMEKQYQSQLKKQAQFTLLEERMVERPGAATVCLLRCEYRASASMLGKSKLTTVSIVNAAHYCERTGRVLVGTIVARPAQIETCLEDYEEILFSLRSRP